MVQAIDKKNNFPAPSVRQRKPDSSTSADNKGKSPQRAVTTGASTSSVIARANGAEQEQVISPELRQLLSRDVITVDKKDSQKHSNNRS